VFAPGARRFEVGSASPAPHVALREAIEVIDGVGVDRIATRIEGLVERLTDRVPSKRLLSPGSPESGLVTIAVPEPAGAVDRLGQTGITVRSLPGMDAVRASVHAVNTAAEMDALADGLACEF
jgi:selenocysteine lyase/cysteine desulfurase